MDLSAQARVPSSRSGCGCHLKVTFPLSQAMLGELPTSQGKVSVQGTLSYAPQEVAPQSTCKIR